MTGGRVMGEPMFDLSLANGVARLTMCRPPVNAISAGWLKGFHELLDGLASGDDWSVLHLRSAQHVFCAGADLGEMRARFEGGLGGEALGEEFARSTRAIHDLFDRIEALPQVTLAEIGGAAMGGGFELALACDLRIAGEEAKLGLPETRLGLIPGAGGTQRLSRLVGPGIAARLILGCEIVDGATARDLGLVQWSAPAPELPARAAAIAERIAGLPAHAVAAAKSCLAAARDPSRDGFAEEISATRNLVTTKKTQALVSDFLKGRR
ncbi:MAG: enoyl-CoA hydratase/isomerase family protein [Alphaproteobacteria bacterium]